MRRTAAWTCFVLFGAVVVGTASSVTGAASPNGSPSGIVQIEPPTGPYSYVAQPVGGAVNPPFYTLPDQVQHARDLEGFSLPALSPDAQHYAYNDPQGTNGTPDTKVGQVGTSAVHLSGLPGRSVDVSVPPVWSPDGLDLAVLVFSKQLYEDDLFVVRADGSRAEKVASDLLASRPAWSPDGNRLAYWRDPTVIHNGPEAIATVDLRNGRTTIVHRNVGFSTFQTLVWFSGRTLLVSHGVNNQDTAYQIQQVPAQGGPLRPLPRRTPVPQPLLAVTGAGQLVVGGLAGQVLFYGPDGSLASGVPTASQVPILQWVPGRLAPPSIFDQGWDRRA